VARKISEKQLAADPHRLGIDVPSGEDDGHHYLQVALDDPSWAKLVRSGPGLDRLKDLVDVGG
jgi:hypothetical protein